MMAMAKELCTTGFLPAAVKTPAQAVAIIMTGRELGLGPMQSLRSICIIQGKPELAADLQLSIFHRDGGRSKWLALTEQKAMLWLRHPNGDEHTETFTMDDAKRAGLAGGSNWLKYPKAMLRSRAITAGLKSVGFEPLAGAYAPGEIGGPEIVGPEPETVPEASGPEVVKFTPSGQARQDAATATKPATPAPATIEKPWPQTVKTREWLISKKLVNMRELATEYFQKAGILPPSEALEDLKLEWLPLNAAQVKLLGAAITDFGNGAEAKKPYEPKPLPEEPKPAAAPAPAPKPAAPPAKPDPAPHLAKVRQDPEWWRDIIVPVPNKGQKRAEYIGNPDTIGSLYDQCKTGTEAACKRLWGFVNHFEPKPWTGRDGVQRPASDVDVEFREALDAFADWHDKHGEDTEPSGAAAARAEAEDGQRDPSDDDVPF
jgi:hypothetical protein